MISKTALVTFLATCVAGFSAWAGTLWHTDFEAADLSGRTAYSSSGSVAAASSYGAFGTIVTVGSNTSSQGLSLTVDSSAATGAWTAGVTTGPVLLTTPNATITNLGLITLSFSLRASQAHPVVLKVESYDSNGLRTGGLRTLIYPATANYYQRFAIDLSTMTADGAGVFVPTNPKIAVSFELDSTAGGDGWPNTAGLNLKIDNFHYATPAYYVKPAASGGSDSNSAGAGTTEDTAFATPNFAVGKAVAGDILVVKGGTYAGTAVSFGAKAGAPDAWISLKNYPGETPVIRYGIWNAIYIGAGTKTSIYTGAAPCYLEVRGITVRGYSGIDANGDRFLDPTLVPNLVTKLGVYGETNGNGISVEGRYMTQLAHDFRFADNVVEYNPGAGISWLRADRVMVERNIVRNNCWWMIYGGSGISTLVAADFETNSDYRMVIQSNQTYGNETMVPWYSATNRFSDGNGIIIDTNRNSDVTTATTDPAYAGKTLVQNNLSFNNGGSGIHSYNSQNVDILHNTAYLNSASPHLQYSQIYAGSSKNVQMLGNILVAPVNTTGITSLNEPVTSNSGNSGTLVFQNNLYSGGNTALPSIWTDSASGNVNANPAFFSASIDPAAADFHLRASSPAVNAARSPAAGNANALANRSALDLALRPRLLGGTSDQGAYQIQSGEVFAPNFSPLPGKLAAAQSITLASDTAGATIVYTTDGSTPTVNAAGTVTNGAAGTSAPVSAAAPTLKAIAWKTGMTTSLVSSGTYTFNDVSTVPIPDLIFYPPGGNFATAQSLAIICRTPGAQVRYTLDGSMPTSTTGTLLLANNIDITANVTVKAIAFLPGRVNSPVHSEDYVVIQPYTAPVFTPPAGTYFAAQSVSLSAPAGATIRYTLDGTTPSSTAGTVYSSPIPVTGNLTLKAIAYSAAGTTPASTVATGVYTIDPVLTVSPISVSRVLPASTTVSSTFTLSNPGALAHTYTLSVRGSGAPTSYAVKKTGDPAGPVFVWQDISTSGTLITALEGQDDGVATSLPLGLSFPFYGTNFTTVNLCSNGYLSFTSTEAFYSNASLPNSTATIAPGNLIALYWDDLYLRTSPAGHAYYSNVANSAFIAQLSGASHYNYTDAAKLLTAQAILKSGGEIVLQYLSDTLPSTDNYTIGVQNSSGTVGQNVAYNTAYVTNNLAVRLTPQGPTASGVTLSSPVTVTVPAGGTANVTVQFNSATLANGTYSGTLQISSDSVLHPLTLVPLNLTVASTLTWAQWQALWFDSTQLANTAISGTLADPDGDGVGNLLERSAGRSPTNAQSTPLVTAQQDASGRLAITFTRDTTAGDLTYTVLVSSDLATWTPIASSTNGAATVNLNGLSASIAEGTSTPLRTVTVTDASTVAPRFLRVEVKIP